MTLSNLKKCILPILIMFLLAGCAGKRAFVSGTELMQEGKYDEAVSEYFRATTKDPENKEYRMRLLDARLLAAREHLEKGRRLAEGKDYRAAIVEFEQATALDPSADIAVNELKDARGWIRVQELLQAAEQYFAAKKFSQAKSAINEILQLRPGYQPALDLQARIQGERKPLLDGVELDVTSAKPVTLKFNNANIKEVFNILSKLSGINFIFDEDIRAQKVSVLLEDASFAQALELLLNMNKLGKMVLNPKTIIIYPKTKDKEKQYEDQLIQTFYLSNIDAKKAVNMLRTMLQLRKIYVHEELNALVIRDTPEVIKLAQQIIEAADRADSEVLYDVELIEVSHTDNLDFGPKLSTYSTNFGFVNPGTSTLPDGSVTVSGLSRLNFLYTLPTATYDFQKSLTDSEILANPKLRVKNKEKAKILVGSREPILTTTINGDTTAENVQYVDVGVKLDIEPNIQLDNSVVTKLTVEVSNKGASITTQSTTVFPINTTTAQTSLILKDGERTILGGLIRDDSNKSRSSIAFLGDIPIIGNLITHFHKEKVKREILLSITPYIVKNVEVPPVDVSTIWSGGEDALKAGPIFGSFVPVFEPVTLPSPAPEVSAGQAPGAGPGKPETGAVPKSSPALPVAEALPPAVAPFPVEPPMGPEPTGEEAVPPAGAAAIPGRAYLSGPGQVQAGEEFTVEVLVEGMQNLYSAPLFIDFDGKLIEFLRAEEGDFLKQGGQPTIFTSSANQNAGKVIVGNKRELEDSGASGSGKLLQLVFKAKNAGTAKIGLERLNFRDPEGKKMSVTTTGIGVEVR